MVVQSPTCICIGFESNEGMVVRGLQCGFSRDIC